MTGWARAEEVVAAVSAVARDRGDRSAWIGVDGFGAAGKSTLAAHIAAGVSDTRVVAVDDFWGPSFAEWDWDRFRHQVLAPLLAGRDARYQVWDWERDAGGRWVELPAGGVVVVEGVSSTRAEAGVPWDLTVWVDSPAAIRLERALTRDGEAMRTRWLADWIPSEQAYAARERPRQRVDFLVDGTT